MPTDRELFEFEDALLLRYIKRAKGKGELEDANRAMHVLLYKHESRMRSRVVLRLPEHLMHHADTVAEWVLERVMRSALGFSFEGEHVGQWVNWWGTVIDRQVISFWRSAQGQALAQESMPPSEHEREDRKRSDFPGEDFDVGALVNRLSYHRIMNSVLESMDNQTHAAIVRTAYSDNSTSAEVAKRFKTTAQNVDQVKSRFRKEFRAECERQGITGP